MVFVWHICCLRVRSGEILVVGRLYTWVSLANTLILQTLLALKSKNNYYMMKPAVGIALAFTFQQGTSVEAFMRLPRLSVRPFLVSHTPRSFKRQRHPKRRAAHQPQLTEDGVWEVKVMQEMLYNSSSSGPPKRRAPPCVPSWRT